MVETRLAIIDEILSMVDDEKYVIIFGDSHYGKSTFIKEIDYRRRWCILSIKIIN